MMKDTSIKAYHEIKEDGTLTRRQKETLRALGPAGKATARQLSAFVPGAWKRLSELEAMGAVKVCGEIKDQGTGKTVSVYTPTGNPPVKPQRPAKDDADGLGKLVGAICIRRLLEAYPKVVSAVYDEAYKKGFRDAMTGKNPPQDL